MPIFCETCDELVLTDPYKLGGMYFCCVCYIEVANSDKARVGAAIQAVQARVKQLSNIYCNDTSDATGTWQRLEVARVALSLLRFDRHGLERVTKIMQHMRGEVAVIEVLLRDIADTGRKES